MHFYSYNKKYGYKKGEKVLSLLSRLIADSVTEDMNFFIGHTLKDDFVIITNNNKFPTKLIQSFNKILPYLYKDLKVKNKLSLSINKLTSNEIKNKHLKISEIFRRLGVN